MLIYLNFSVEFNPEFERICLELFAFLTAGLGLDAKFGKAPKKTTH